MLDLKSVSRVNANTFLATNDQAYTCAEELVSTKDFDKQVRKFGKRLAVNTVNVTEVPGKGFRIHSVVLPPGVEPVGSNQPAETPEHFLTNQAMATRAPILDFIPVDPVECCNEYVALLQLDESTGSIVLPESVKSSRNDAYVIGVGPGVAQNGARVPSQLQYGDKVVFNGAPACRLETLAKDGVTPVELLLISERNIICKLPQKK